MYEQPNTTTSILSTMTHEQILNILDHSQETINSMSSNATESINKLNEIERPTLKQISTARSSITELIHEIEARSYIFSTLTQLGIDMSEQMDECQTAIIKLRMNNSIIDHDHRSMRY